MRKVVVDTDFFQFVTMGCEESIVFLKIVDEMQIIPVIHQFVYKEELHENAFVKKLIDNGNLHVIQYNDFLKNQADQDEYKKLFQYAYKEMNFREFEEKNVFTYRHEKENLGEIHSVVMARMEKLNLFMSNDGAAKEFVVKKLNTARQSISVMNVEDIFSKLAKKSDRKIAWKDIKNVVKQYKNSDFKADQEKYKRLQGMWVMK